MKNYRYVFIILGIFLLFGCQEKKDQNAYIIATDYGDITISLYDTTPIHRDNFKKLVKEDFYEDLLFHRVIDSFMIQGGDPESVDAAPGKVLGEADAGYTLPAEFVDTLFHKKGVVAAAREGDAANPEKRSSSSQFYIVQGKVFTEKELDALEQKRNQQKRKKIVNDFLKNKQETLMKQGKDINFEVLVPMAEEYADSLLKAGKAFHYSKKQREIYTTIGGTPHLDGNYTVFGEVIDGIEVVDKIAAQETDEHDRPVEDIEMKITKK